MSQFFAKLLNGSKNETVNKIDCTPSFFHLQDEPSKEEFHTFLKEHPNIHVTDEIYSQLSELLKLRFPKRKFTSDELKDAISDHTAGVDLLEYGQWVYYPWLNKVVHVLPKEEFVEVRTNRNQYKITPREEELLASKKIGIIGLSVGKAIALTMALERICGELVLADFDVLELSNLNRIQTGVHNCGLKKTVIVAREIAEIDPYLKVTCIHEGLTEGNVDQFFTNGKKLDVCVEVCDGLYTKIFARQKAKELGVPVVMNSSDRGTTDIERFDLETDLPILHGLIDHLDLSKVKQAKTNEEKVPYLLPMLGVETSSDRLKASMLEIQETITTWPQLASGVVFGGGICTDVCRRILLNQLTKSGRYFVDVEDIIQDDDYNEQVEKPLNIKPSLTDEEMLTLIKRENDIPCERQTSLDRETVKKIVEAGSKAPSGANIQSWKWMYHNRTLYMFFDDIFTPELLDCKRTTMLTGLGAATENIVLKAHQLGFEVITSTMDEISEESTLITKFRFFEKRHERYEADYEPHICDYLSTSIDDRVSNRRIVNSKSIAYDRLSKLKRIAQTIPGADMIILNDSKKLAELADITGKMDRIRYTSKGGHTDFRGEARWTVEEAEKTRTGISFQETMDLTPTEYAGFYVSKDWSVVRNLANWNLGSAYEKIQRKWINGSAAVGLITMPTFSTNNFYEGGRVLERVWLAASYDNISVHPPSLSTLIFNSLVYEEKEVLPAEMEREAKSLLKQFEDLFEINAEIGKVLLLRFFISEPPEFRALKYNVEQVLSFSEE